MATTGLVGCALVISALSCAEGGDDPGAGANNSTGGTSASGGAGGDTGTGGDGGGGGSGTGGSGNEGGCSSVDGLVLAMDELFLGDIDFGHVASPTAWQNFGVDVDGLNTVNDFSAHCLPNSGADPNQAFPDGNWAVDNAFGKTVLPLLESLIPGIATQANLAITTGQFTLMLFLEGLVDPDHDPLTTYYFGGSPLAGPPLWDGSDCWPVRQEDLLDPTDISSAKVTFEQSTVVADSWESGTPTTLVVPLNILGFEAPVTIYQARMSMMLNPSHSGSALGQISGVVDTEEFAQVVRDVGGTINPTLCNDAVITDLLVSIRQASDIMKDGTQDPSSVCDGISVGLGYTMLKVGFGGIAPPAIQPPDPCP